MSTETSSKRPGRRAHLIIVLFAFALVLLPFLFWYQTWFGRRLPDRDIGKYLTDTSKPRQSQHALVQIGDRLAAGDTSVRQWYPQVIQVSSSPTLELRQTAAWIMGQDHTYAPFHEPLRKLLKDPEPMVRRNAALSLSNFRDADALPEIRAMLQPSTIVAPVSGVLTYRLKEGDRVNPGTLVARIGETEVRTQLPGEVRSLARSDGAEVKQGEPIVHLSADNDHAWEGLRALHGMGQAEDLEAVGRFVRGWPGMPDRLRQQAELTLAAIKSRVR